MHIATRPVLAAAATVISLIAVPGATAAPSPARTSYPATVRVVVAPVTSTGHSADGYAVHSVNPKLAVDCSYPDASPGAVSPNIEFCSPSAAYAIACWKSATAHRVLCIQDPTKRKLIEFSRQGRFAKTKIAKPRYRAPLLVVLTDGTRCQIRDGGAWGQPKGHPNLYGAYSCDRHGVGWLYAKGSHSDPHNGVDESTPSWRLRVGENNIVWRHIAKAYFVATAS